MTTAEVRTPDNPPGLRDIPFQLPKKTGAQKRRAGQIYKALSERYPEARCELDYENPYQLLVATILSAQATDVGVNKATPALFEKFPDARALAKSSPAKIEPYIKTIGLFRNKAKAIHGAATTIVENFGGEVPDTMEDLLTLRGVARKTANVVLGNAYGINVGVVVDTHVDRVSKRFGLVPDGANAQQAERHLMALFPRDTWCMLSHLLIFHGRRVCKARNALCAEDAICRRFCSNAKSTPTKKTAPKKTAAGKKSSRRKTSKKPRTR